MAFLLDPCCCSCLENPPDEIAVSVSGLSSRAKIVNTDLDNPTDISPFNGTWYLEGPESNWRDSDWSYDFVLPPRTRAVLHIAAQQICAYSAAIDPIPVQITKPYWLDYSTPPDIICTIDMVTLCFLIGRYRTYDNDPWTYSVGLTWLNADQQAIVSLFNWNPIYPPQHAGYNIATQLDAHWNGQYIGAYYPYWNDRATIQVAADCASITEDYGMSAFYGDLASNVFGQNTTSMWIP